MRHINISVGGHKGEWGRCFVHARGDTWALGIGFHDPDERDVKVAALLDMVEERVGEPCVLGILTEHYDGDPQGDLINDDRRVTPKAKPKPRSKSKASRQGKRHGQQYTTPGYWQE